MKIMDKESEQREEVYLERKSTAPTAGRGPKRGGQTAGLCLMAYIAARKKFQTKNFILIGWQPFDLPSRANQASA
jgi:hypothetical protein